MQLNNLKKALFSSLATVLTLSVVTACGSNDTTLNQLPAVDSSLTAASASTAKFKFGFNINAKTPKVPVGTLRPTNGVKKKVDLREFCSPIANQEDLGACTAFAIGKGVREFLLIRDHKPLEQLSPLFLYYNERVIDGNVDEDAGSTMTTGFKSLKETGIATEASWPYNTKKFNVKPPQEAYDSALGYEVTNTKRLNGLQQIKDALDGKNPVAFGIYVYESFMKAKNGVIPVPDVENEKMLGGHAVACVGYDDAKQVLIMRNSWGTTWGDKGYFYLPYKFFSEGLVADAWTASSTALTIK